MCPWGHKELDMTEQLTFSQSWNISRQDQRDKPNCLGPTIFKMAILTIYQEGCTWIFLLTQKKQLETKSHWGEHKRYVEHIINHQEPAVFIIQSLSHVWLFATTQTAAHQASLSTISQSLLKLMFIQSVTPSHHLMLCCPLLLLLSVFPGISLFQWVSSSHQVAKVLEQGVGLIFSPNTSQQKPQKHGTEYFHPGNNFTQLCNCS